MTTYKNDHIKTNIINSFSKTIEMFNLTPLEARLLVYLYMEDMPKTLDEMGDAMGKSKTSISTNIRSLLELNLVTRVWKKGIRKDLYQASTDLFQTFIKAYVKKRIDSISHQRATLERIKKEQLSDKTHITKKYNDILYEIIAFHKELENTFGRMNNLD